MKVKVIEVCFPAESEKIINEFLSANTNIEIIRTDIHSNIRLEYYSNFIPPQICNQFYEFTVFIYYKA